MNAITCFHLAAATALLLVPASGQKTLTTPHEAWHITFTPGIWASTAPDNNWALTTDAQTIADIVDPSTAASGEFRGLIDGFQSSGFRDPRIDFKNIFLDHINLPASAPAGSRVDGNANRVRIKINTDTIANASISTNDLRETLTHEMFHGVEYAYCDSFLGIDQEDAIGGLFTEGLAATIEDKIWNSVDANGSSGYVGPRAYLP
jgi:hypothetical protein